MSTSSTFKSGLVAAACIAGLSLSACASNSNSGRYGSVYDYESSGQCLPSGNCQAAPVVAEPVYDGASRYGGETVSSGVVYADCSQVGGMSCNPPVAPMPMPAPAPAPVYSGVQTTYSGPVQCPSGTRDNGDGTCMMTSGSYGSTTTYEPTVVQSSGQMADCPAGTTPNGDGTCMEHSSPSVEIYTPPTTGYQVPETYTPPTTYLPIRK